jgi:hypothetical protein
MGATGAHVAASNLYALPMLISNGCDTVTSHYGDVGAFSLELGGAIADPNPITVDTF